MKGDPKKKLASKSKPGAMMGATMTPGAKPYVKLIKKEVLPKMKKMGKVK